MWAKRCGGQHVGVNYARDQTNQRHGGKARHDSFAVLVHLADLPGLLRMRSVKCGRKGVGLSKMRNDERLENLILARLSQSQGARRGTTYSCTLPACPVCSCVCEV